MSAAMMTPDPGPGDVAAEVEAWLASQTPPATPPAVDEPMVPVVSESQRVRVLRAEVAEAHQLLRLQADNAPLLVDTDKVRKRRKNAAETARLHALARQPALLAWQAARWRRVLTAVAFTALVLALGWSTAGVQVFAAEAAPVWSPAWCFAWLVEPFLSMALLTVVAARAYLATRGQPLEHGTLKRVERLFLALTLGMNVWPHLPGVTDRATVSGVVLHMLGPVVAVAIVTVLPIIWRAFADLDHGDTGPAYPRPYSPLTAPSYRENTTPGDGPEGGVTGALVTRALALIATGELSPAPSANALRQTLGCGMDAARVVRDELRKGDQG